MGRIHPVYDGLGFEVGGLRATLRSAASPMLLSIRTESVFFGIDPRSPTPRAAHSAIVPYPKNSRVIVFASSLLVVASLTPCLCVLCGENSIAPHSHLSIVSTITGMP